MALSSDSIFVGFKTGSFIFIDYIILLIFVGKSKWLTKKKSEFNFEWEAHDEDDAGI